MEKSVIFDEKKPRSGDSRLTTTILATALLVLSLTFVVLALCSTIYLSKQTSDESKTTITLVTPDNKVDEEEPKEQDEPKMAPLEFYMGMPVWQFDEQTIVHQFISVDQQKGTEFIAFKDPNMMHIQNIIHVDHQRGVVVLYGSETAECMFVRDRSSSLSGNLRYLWANDGRNVTETKLSRDYKRGNPLASLEEIPSQMTGLCSLSNSYWLIEARTGDWSVSDKYHVCICGYFKCFCTYCEDVLCWGRCCEYDVVA